MIHIYTIGIALRCEITDSKLKYFVKDTYLNYLMKLKLVPFFINIHNLNNNILGMCDGFLLPGGNDIDPIFYKEENIASQVDTLETDILDKQIIEYAKNNKKPLLGICRGHQSINVFMGGSLNQDIKNHQNKNHLLTIKDIDFSNFMQRNQFISNSYHHQSIKKLAPNFKVLAISEDNTIEMIEHETLPIIGIQFHPEIFKELDVSLKLLDYFALKLSH